MVTMILIMIHQEQLTFLFIELHFDQIIELVMFDLNVTSFIDID